MVEFGKRGDMVDWALTVLLSIIVIASLLPMAFNSLHLMVADTGNFTATERALLSIIGIIVVILIVYKFYKQK